MGVGKVPPIYEKGTKQRTTSIIRNQLLPVKTHWIVDIPLERCIQHKNQDAKKTFLQQSKLATFTSLPII